MATPNPSTKAEDAKLDNPTDTKFDDSEHVMKLWEASPYDDVTLPDNCPDSDTEDHKGHKAIQSKNTSTSTSTSSTQQNHEPTITPTSNPPPTSSLSATADREFIEELYGVSATEAEKLLDVIMDRYRANPLPSSGGSDEDEQAASAMLAAMTASLQNLELPGPKPLASSSVETKPGSQESQRDDINYNLLSAVLAGNESQAKSALSANANVDVKHPKTGMTPLMIAAERGSTKLATMLLESKADILTRRTDGHKDDALAIASRNGHEALALIILGESFVRTGGYANCEQTDKDGMSLLLNAASRSQRRLVDALILNGANKNVKGPNGEVLEDLLLDFHHEDGDAD